MAGFWQSAWERIGGTRPAYDPPESDRPPGVQALQLLVRNLSPAQRQQFARHDYFDVIGSDTGRRYRIRVGRTLNVAQLNASGGCVRLLCFEPQGQLPVGDVMLAQKIALELFESETIRVANKSPTWELGRELLWPDRRIDRHDHLRRSRHQRWREG
jgi:hypothetical protein